MTAHLLLVSEMVISQKPFIFFYLTLIFLPLLDKFQDCLNMELGKKQKVAYFRLQNCAVNPEKNQSAISAVVSNPLRLDCEILESEKFNHVMWITPLGTIKVYTVPQIYMKSHFPKLK